MTFVYDKFVIINVAFHLKHALYIANQVLPHFLCAVSVSCIRFNCQSHLFALFYDKFVIINFAFHLKYAIYIAYCQFLCAVSVSLAFVLSVKVICFLCFFHEDENEVERIKSYFKACIYVFLGH